MELKISIVHVRNSQQEKVLVFLVMIYDYQVEQVHSKTKSDFPDCFLQNCHHIHKLNLAVVYFKAQMKSDELNVRFFTSMYLDGIIGLIQFIFLLLNHTSQTREIF